MFLIVICIFYSNELECLLKYLQLFFLFLLIFLKSSAPFAIYYGETVLFKLDLLSALWILIKQFNIYTLYDYIY